MKGNVMAEQYYSTIEVSRMLNIHPSRLSRAVWVGKIPQPIKSPGKGVFLWTRNNIEQASQYFRGCGASDIFKDGTESDAVLADERFLAIAT